MLPDNFTFRDIPLIKRYLTLICIILFSILLVFTAEYILKYLINKNWNEILVEKETEFENEIKRKFREYQLSLQKKLEIVQNKIESLKENYPINQSVLFDVLNSVSDNGIAIILYDSTGKLIAWKNTFTQVVDLDQSKLNHYFVTRSNIYKFLNYSSCIQIKGGLKIYAILSRLLDQNFSISSRFIQTDLHQRIFSGEFKRNILLIENLDETGKTQDYKTLQLFSLENIPLIYVRYYPLTIDDVYDELENYFNIIRIILFLAFGITLFIILFSLTGRRFATPLREILIILELWLFRYFLLWIGFPSEITDISIFNPSYFASSFGYGIAKSIAELLITSIALFLSVHYLSNVFNYLLIKGLLKPRLLIYKYLITLLSFFLILIIFRGYFAILISAIHDSNMNYVEQTQIVPSFEIIVMYIALMCVTFSFVILGLYLAKIAYSVLIESLGRLLVYITFLITILLATLIFMIHPNPLFTLIQGVMILTAFVALIIIKDGIEKVTIGNKSFILTTLISSILITFFFYSAIEKSREQKLIDLANQITQPFDDWMAFIVDEALNEMSGFDFEKNIALINKQDIAFNLWANSILSQKGYDCRLTIIDTNFQVISRFGMGSFIASNQLHDFLKGEKIVKVQEIKTELGEIKYYSGYAPIYNKSGRIIAAILLDVGASRSELLSQYNSNILVAGRDERDYYFYKTFYSEFENQYLSYSTNQEFSKYYEIPVEVLNELKKDGKKYFCIKEIINDKNYKTVYLNTKNKDRIVSVSVEIPEWKNFEIVRLFIHLLFISLFLFFLFTLKRLRDVLRLSFFAKLMIIFIVVSMIPLFVFSYYNNLYAEARINAEVISDLEKETELIVNQIPVHTSNKVLTEDIISDELCEDISKKTGIDFIFYSDGIYSGSSLMEFIQAELINKIISADAYKKLMIEGRRFFAEAQRIGSFSYYVGYKPVVDYSGKVMGIISVLTLSKIAWLKEEIAQRNMYLFGIYFIVLVFVFVFGFIFSSQISKPLRNLLKYTKIVGTGNLDVRINSERSDEIGELEKAFDKMIADLRQKRDELIRYEKDLAWKEMAKQVAHEIKNPLTPIKLSVQQLYKAFKDGAKNFDEIFNQAYNMITEQIETLNRIASEFSNFARMPERKLELCMVQDVLDEAIQLFTQYPDIKINKHYGEEKLIVLADRDELRRAFVNIIRNSVQALGYSGIIEVSTYRVGNKVQIDIVDNGPGIPDEIAQRIFEPNFSTKSDGMGLGLAIVKKTVDDLGGEISFKTKVGSGTKFSIKLNVESK